MKQHKLGVYVLVAHLVITLAILALYGVFAYLGKPLTTLENMLLVIVGYWFGTMGGNALGRKVDETNGEITTKAKQKMVDKM